MRPRTPTIVLVGLMGTGKSTVAWELSRRLGSVCLDTDKLVEQRLGKSVRQVFAERGEEFFREVESEVLGECLHSPDAVVAAAGGVVVGEANRQMLKRASGRGDALVVWLSAPVETLVRRTANAGHRPLLDADPAGVLARMESMRRSMYEEVADMTIDVSDRSPESVADLVIEALGEVERAGRDRNVDDD